jgi:hypothetical protein
LDEQEYIKKIDELIASEKVEDEDYKYLAIENGRCRNSFTYWIGRYGKLSQAPTLSSPGGMIKFILWEHTKEIIKVLLEKNLVSILKSRQIGASWIVAAYCLWCAEFHDGDKTLLFSKGELEAAELLNKCKIVYDGQPAFLKISIDAKSSTKLSFNIMKSSIEALAATENAGIGYQVSRIVCDEHIEHPYASKNYMSAKPAIDAGGGQFISIFTSNEDKLNSLAVELFIGGINGKNGYTSLFYPYTVRPGRDGEWYDKTRLSIPESELQGITPDMYMARNYPRSIEEALAPSKTIAVFNKVALDGMMGETESGKVVPEFDSNIVHIYRPYTIGEYYIAASDTSHGVGQDYNVTVVMNVKTGAVAADIYNSKLSPEELAYHSVKLLKLYKEPLWFIEDNDWGRVTISTAGDLGYKNFGRYGGKDGKDKPGWHTSESTRTDIWGSLIPAVNNRQIVVYNKDGIKSLYDIVRKPEKNGRIEAMGGRHDDYGMALGIAWFNRDKVIAMNMEYKPIRSLTFKRQV